MDLIGSMRLFVRLAELGSFTKAAEAMQLGRPHVTRAIQKLEASLGVRLFQRTTRQVRLTPEGEQFLERVQDILGSVAEATTMFGPPDGGLRGTLRVDIASALAQPALVHSLRDFTRAHPAIELSLGVTDRNVDLVAEGVDCVVRLGELPDSSLVARRVGLATMLTCAAPAYLKEYGEPRTPADLTNHRGVRFISGQDQRTLPWQFQDGTIERVHVCRQGIAVNESKAYVQCGVAGFGILQAPGIALDRHLADGSLVEVLRRYRPQPRPVSVLYPSKSHLAPQVRAFVEYVCTVFPALYGTWLSRPA